MGKLFAVVLKVNTFLSDVAIYISVKKWYNSGEKGSRDADRKGKKWKDETNTTDPVEG